MAIPHRNCQSSTATKGLFLPTQGQPLKPPFLVLCICPHESGQFQRGLPQNKEKERNDLLVPDQIFHEDQHPLVAAVKKSGGDNVCLRLTVAT